MKVHKSFIVGLVITILLLGGGAVAFYLSQQSQDLRQRAAENDVTPTPTPPVACVDNISTCEWDALPGAVSYHYKVVETDTNTIIDEQDISADVTKATFTSEVNKTYTCTVTATNACGTGDAGSATATCSVDATPTPTETPFPTPTSNLPSPTPTETPMPTPTPTETPIPTATPTPTTPPVPTATPTTPPPGVTVVPTNTPIPPVATAVPPVPTDTPIPGVPTNTPTPTLPSPGSPIETFAIAAGVILTIIGALFLFAL